MAAGKCQGLHSCFVFMSSEGLLFAGHAYTQAGKLPDMARSAFVCLTHGHQQDLNP